MITSRFVAVVTAAGEATRFRPFSHAIPKEMLPIGARPALDLVIDECVAAGANEVIVVTRPGDQVVPAHLDATPHRSVRVDVVEEDVGHGYGNAAPLLTLRERLGTCDLFLVAFGDDVLLPCCAAGRDLRTMGRLADHGAGAGAVIAAQRVRVEQSGSFGIIDTAVEEADLVTGIRQRPDPATVTEPLAVVSRLILRPSILPLLRATEEARGELDLGIAAARLARTGVVRVHRLESAWVTVGDPRSYHHALDTYWSLHTEDASWR